MKAYKIRPFEDHVGRDDERPFVVSGVVNGDRYEIHLNNEVAPLTTLRVGADEEGPYAVIAGEQEEAYFEQGYILTIGFEPEGVLQLSRPDDRHVLSAIRRDPEPWEFRHLFPPNEFSCLWVRLSAERLPWADVPCCVDEPC